MKVIVLIFKFLFENRLYCKQANKQNLENELKSIQPTKLKEAKSCRFGYGLLLTRENNKLRNGCLIFWSHLIILDHYCLVL